MPPLRSAQPSAAALAERVLAALEQKDASGLRALALSEQEFRDSVWPELPAAKPERNVPMAYAWQDLHQKSESGLAAILAEHGGRKYRLRSIRFGKGTTQYRTFVVHRRSIATVVDEQGRELDMSLFGSMLERDGQVKVFSYVVD